MASAFGAIHFEYWAHIGRTNDEFIVPRGIDVDFDGVKAELR